MPDPADPARSAALDQRRTPLLDAMVALARRQPTSFHTPGHKGGHGVPRALRAALGGRPFPLDLTLLEEIDSLHKPVGVIREAQALAAKAWGSAHARFLVNGSTVGNQAALLAACPPGSGVLVARNAHKSALAGLILSGARPAFFAPDPPRPDHAPLPGNVSLAGAIAAMEAHPDCRTLFLTSPSYYGVCADLEQIVPAAHARGVAVIVDEAHGPHLRFHPALPISAIEAGADVVIQSTHKILSAMTQASMLHAQGERVPIEAIDRALRTLQTTSPSYLLMASLDAARMQMATEGRAQLSRVIRLANRARQAIDATPGLRCPPADDPTKLTVLTCGIGLPGYAAARRLDAAGVQVEMADPAGILALVTLGDLPASIDRLIAALQALSAEQRAAGIAPIPHPALDTPCPAAPAILTPREAALARQEKWPLASAVGQIAASAVTVYPPGVPALIPGEKITAEVIAYLGRVEALGGMVDGLEDGEISILEVEL